MPKHPNVLLLLSDEHRFRGFSHLDPNGEGEPVYTPTFDALARRGVSFHNTYCQVPLCTPSRIGMLTGVGPMKSGGWTNCSLVRPGCPTLPQSFAEAGYETCLVGKMHLGGDRQFIGFRHRPYGDLTGMTGHQWEPLSRRGGRAIADRTRDAGLTEVPESILQERIVAEESVAFLREHRHARNDQPWLLCASFSRPHFPLTAPRRHFERYWPDGVTEPKIAPGGDAADHPMTLGMRKGFQTDRIEQEEMLRARAAYFACITWLDEIIGDMLAVLDRDGLLDETIILYTTDHGELMGEHGLWWKNSWHEGCARSPWIVQLPAHRYGQTPGRRLQTPVSLVDLFPTLCGLCNVPMPEGLEGTDLSASVREGSEPERGPVFFSNPLPRWGEGSEHVVVRNGNLKYVAFRGAPDLLFDLETDPDEQHNRVDDLAHREDGRRLRALIDTSYDFDAADAQIAEDAKLTEAHALGCEGRWDNLYHMPSGLVVDGDRMLYDPRVLTNDPASFFSDFPRD